MKDVLLLKTKPLNEWAHLNLHNWMESSNDDEKVTEDLLSCPVVEVVSK